MNEQDKQPKPEIKYHTTNSSLREDLTRQANSMKARIRKESDQCEYTEVSGAFTDDLIHFGATCKAHGWCCSVDEDINFFHAVDRATSEEVVTAMLDFAFRNCRPTYEEGNFDQTTGHSNQRGWGDIKKSQRIPATWEDHSYINDICPSFYHNGCKVYIESINVDERELGNKRYSVYTVDQDYDLQEKDFGFETDDFADVVAFVNSHNDPWCCQRILAYLGIFTLKNCDQAKQSDGKLKAKDFIDNDNVRKAIKSLNFMYDENWLPSVVQEALDKCPAFHVEERYCTYMDVTEPVLVFSFPTDEPLGEIDLVQGHCNPYIDDDFTQDSLETVADDLNGALETYWDELRIANYNKSNKS